jgi:3-phosphoshikimate 1-carboxyvinyltransferase
MVTMGVTVTAQMTHRDPEPVGTVTVEGPGRLRAFSVEAPAVPSLIDELPVLAVLATQAYGTTRIQGAQELRVKESDRISAMGDGLRALGAQIEDREDGWIISGPALLRGTSVDSRGDHRVAMALAVAAAIAKGETRIAQAASVSISYPEFWTVMEQTGAIEIDRRGLYPV